MPGYALFARLAYLYGEKIAILAFPSREYANEEFDTNEKIAAFAEQMNFPFKFGREIGYLMALGSVQGDQAPALWKYLRDSTNARDPAWNFASAYLVSKTGRVYCVSPRDVEAGIASLLAE